MTPRRGRPPLPDAERSNLTIRLRKATRDILDELAARRGVTVGRVVKDAIAVAVQAKGPSQAPVPSPPQSEGPRTPRRPSQA